MKIAFLTNVCSSTGGVGSYVMRLAGAFAEKEIAVTIIHNDTKAETLPSARISQKYVKDFDPFEPKDSSQKISEVMEILNQEKPDLVHVHANTHFELESEIRKSYPAVKSLHVYDFCPSGNKFHHALGKICHHPTGPMCLPRMIYKRCTTSWRPSTISMFYRRTVKSNQNDAGYRKILTASRYVRQQALESGYSSEQVEVVPYFVNSSAQGTLISAEKNLILFTGRIFPEKGLDHLLRALALLPKNLSWKLAVDGDGPVLNEMKRLAENLGIASKTDFLGWLGRGAHERLYQQASIIAFPSVWPEPFGLVGIEAMNYGKPVVAFNVGGISDWLDDQKTGFLIRPYDLKEMASRFEELLTDSSLCRKFGEEGRSQVLKKFSKELHLQRILNIYENVKGEFK